MSNNVNRIGGLEIPSMERQKLFLGTMRSKSTPQLPRTYYSYRIVVGTLTVRWSPLFFNNRKTLKMNLSPQLAAHLPSPNFKANILSCYRLPIEKWRVALWVQIQLLASYQQPPVSGYWLAPSRARKRSMRRCLWSWRTRSMLSMPRYVIATTYFTRSW